MRDGRRDHRRKSHTRDAPPQHPRTGATKNTSRIPPRPPLSRRSGLGTPGVGWRRDPLGPRFQTNFVRGQRFLQISAAMPGTEGAFRLAPIAFLHTPTPQKPDRTATPEQVAQYRLDAGSSRLSLRAAEQMIRL